MKIEQTAGKVAVTIDTDGWPRFPVVKFCSLNGTGHEGNVRVEDLHDLIYCCQRTLDMLAALEEAETP